MDYEGNQSFGRPKTLANLGKSIETQKEDPRINYTQTRMTSSLVYMMLYRGEYGK
jgi:hypothetical protein